MLELQLDPRLPAPLREPYLREARRAGLSLADLEAMSFDHRLVREFLAAAREGQGAAFVRELDADRLEDAMRRATGADVHAEGMDALARALARRS